MEPTKWTPGPWFRREGAEWIIDGEGCGRIASVGLGRDQVDANAHLIAAAPELYAALEVLVQFYHTAGFTDGFFAEAMSALAKARGEAL